MRKMKRFITAAMLLVLVLAFGMQAGAATKTYTMYVGKTYRIKQSGVKKWTTSNKKIAAIGSKNGKIKPKRPGTVTIKAKKKKKTVKFKVIVKKPYISKTSLKLEKGQTATLKLTGTTAKSWKSSKSSVVSVTSKGKIKAKAAGMATITVRGSNKKTYQCRVTVPKPYVPPKQPEPEPAPEPAPQPEPETEPQMPEPGPFTGYLIMHRGYNKVAPENTLAAFRLAAEMGYKAVECDIQFTKDGVPVVIHDSSVTRTSNVAIVETELFGAKKRKLSELTFDEVRQLDFGSWKAEAYAGEKIPSFQEFLELCKQYGLHPYIELKSNGDLPLLYSMTVSTGMQNQVTWISFDINLLNRMKHISSTAELGWLRSGLINPSTIAGARAIQLPTNKVYLMPKTWNLSADMLKECWKYNIGLIAQSIYSQQDQDKMNSYYTAGITNGF
mgnify:FL=1